MKTRIITAILLSSSFLNALCITHQTHFPVDGDSFCEWEVEDMANTRLRLDYVGNRVYRNGTLERIGFDVGYIDGNGTYCYCLRDWQGNNRVVLTENDSIIESDNYYPYGQHFTEGAQAAYSAQRWKFGDKEFDAEKGLNWHDFGARFLMPQFGLFTTQDPLRHRNWHLSPYLYCAASPIRFIDPTGMDWMKATYGNETFLYFSKEITSQEDINYYFKEQNEIEYVGKELNVSVISGKEVKHRFQLLPDGSFKLDGVRQKQEYNSELLHISNDGISEICDNYYGVYLGPNNPKIKGKDNDSYAIPPINELDYSAYKHDKYYDLVGAKGAKDAFFNVRTLPADINLAKETFQNRSHSPEWSYRTSLLFSMISSFKIWCLLHQRF